MSIVDTYILETIIAITTKYADRSVNPSDHVVADLAITRGDAVEFYGEIEHTFEVDLRPITEKLTESREKSRLTGVPLDPTISQIASYIEQQLL